MTRHSASRGILYSAPPTAEAEDSMDVAETTSDVEPATADD
ncbi:hypothetical protein ACKVMT_08380 [Halobacteriales archaeon Cl-PHB]